jgi:hypothetical protein
MHADPLAVHGLQFRLDREDEDFDVGQGVLAVATAGSGHTANRRQVGIAAKAGARHRPNMVGLGRRNALCVETDLKSHAYFVFRL